MPNESAMSLRSIVLALILLLCVLAPAAAGPNNTPKSGGGPSGQMSKQELYMGGFEGTWVGKLRQIDASAYDANIGYGKAGTESDVAIVVAGAAVKVMIRSDGKWSEVKPGAFRIAQHKTNATIYAIDSASDVYDTTGSGGWVESWTFTLTHKDAGTLYAGWWRAVSNYLRKPDEKSARFFSSSFGELKKAATLPP